MASTPIPDVVRNRLWHDRADLQVYVILDGAQNETLLDVMADHEELDYRCLINDKLEPDMQEVAPYLIHLVEDAPFTQWLLEHGWAQNWGIFLTSQEELPSVWRHLRQHTRVWSPERRRLFFRFYDPRVLNAFLPTCDAGQLEAFFGNVDQFVAEREGPGAWAYSLADGALVTEGIEAV
jgi:hypothetical protein